jgi:outer membrane autotransporter protein
MTAYTNDYEETDRSGYFGIVYAGIDTKIAENTILGIMISVDWAEEDATGLASIYAGDSEVSGVGWMIGPYLSTALLDNVFLDVRASYGKSNNNIDIDILDSDFSGEFETTRWLVQGSLSGQYAWHDLTLVPEATVSYLNEEQDKFSVKDDGTKVGVDSQSFSLGRLRVSTEIALRREWEHGTFTPYVKPSLIWDFASTGEVIVDGDANLDGEVDDAGALRAAVEGGLRTMGENGVTSDMSVTYDGIGTAGLSAITFRGALNVPF